MVRHLRNHKRYAVTSTSKGKNYNTVENTAPHSSAFDKSNINALVAYPNIYQLLPAKVLLVFRKGAA